MEPQNIDRLRERVNPTVWTRQHPLGYQVKVFGWVIFNLHVGSSWLISTAKSLLFSWSVTCQKQVCCLRQRRLAYLSAMVYWCSEWDRSFFMQLDWLLHIILATINSCCSDPYPSSQLIKISRCKWKKRNKNRRRNIWTRTGIWIPKRRKYWKSYPIYQSWNCCCNSLKNWC